MCKFIKKSDEWILHKPTELTILGLFFNIHVAMSAIQILRLTKVMSYKYILSSPNLNFMPAEGVLSNTPMNSSDSQPTKLSSANEQFDVWTGPLKHLTLKCQKLFEHVTAPSNCVNDTNRKRYSDPRNIWGLSVNFSARLEYAASFRYNHVQGTWGFFSWPILSFIGVSFTWVTNKWQLVATV